jgi:hypothetical protein
MRLPVVNTDMGLTRRTIKSKSVKDCHKQRNKVEEKALKKERKKERLWVSSKVVTQESNLHLI